MTQIYLDNAATTQVDKKVLKAMLPYFSEKFGNASSQHLIGQEAKRALEESRTTIARSINAKSDEIIFTSSGTESNNLALKGLFFANPDKKHIITTKIEHDSVLNICKWLEEQGAKITYLDVDSQGFVNPDEVKQAINDKTLVVSIIHANNEIGTIQPIEQIGKICREKNVYFHTDACQSFTKTEINVKKQNIDMITLNAHKIHGPKGVGALYVSEDVTIEKITDGGFQEFNLRGGTENVSGIAGFGKACEIFSDEDVERIKYLRNDLYEQFKSGLKGVQLNGSSDFSRRIPNNLNLSFDYIEGESVVLHLDMRGISVITGSA